MFTDEFTCESRICLKRLIVDGLGTMIGKGRGNPSKCDRLHEVFIGVRQVRELSCLALHQ